MLASNPNDTLRIIRAAALVRHVEGESDYRRGRLSGLSLSLICLGWDVRTAAGLVANAGFCF